MKLLLIALIVVSLCAAPAVFAKPPKELVEYVTSFPVIFDGKCTVDGLFPNPTECLVLSDMKDTAFLIMFTDSLVMTHILKFEKDKMEVLWDGEKV